jgi:glycosyltransferase involved in cell wall biosynthesis
MDSFKTVTNEYFMYYEDLDQCLRVKASSMKILCVTDAKMWHAVSASSGDVLQIAYGLGVPVIATAVGGLAETVRDGETGYLVPPENPKALAAVIKKYFAQDRSAEFRQNIRAQRGEFYWSRMVQFIESMVRDIQL